MRKIMLAALAAAAVLSGAVFSSQAAAMTAALPSLRAAANAALPIQRVRNICGLYGCAAVQTKRIQKPLKFTAKAAPLVVTGAIAPAPAPAAPAKPWPLSLLH